jgi:hypothetical protein
VTVRAETGEQARLIARKRYSELHIRTVFVVYDREGQNTGLRDYTFKGAL